jgi:hypothetical protein
VYRRLENSLDMPQGTCGASTGGSVGQCKMTSVMTPTCRHDGRVDVRDRIRVLSLKIGIEVVEDFSRCEDNFQSQNIRMETPKSIKDCPPALVDKSPPTSTTSL